MPRKLSTRPRRRCPLRVARGRTRPPASGGMIDEEQARRPRPRSVPRGRERRIGPLGPSFRSSSAAVSEGSYRRAPILQANRPTFRGTASDLVPRLGRMAAKSSSKTCAPSAAWRARAGSAGPGCGVFGTLVEELSPRATAQARPERRRRCPSVTSRRTKASAFRPRCPELDRALGGGRITGPPSTRRRAGRREVVVAPERARAIAWDGRRALLVTAEIGRSGLVARYTARGAETVEILAETELDTVSRPSSRSVPTPARSTPSRRCMHPTWRRRWDRSPRYEAAGRLLRIAKSAGVGAILVGHVTKDGAVAGPACSSTSSTACSSSKATVTTRTGSCVRRRIGSGRRRARGLRDDRNRARRGPGSVGVLRSDASGRDRSCSRVHARGSRPLLLEIQSLVSPTDLAMPRRVGTGVDPSGSR